MRIFDYIKGYMNSKCKYRIEKVFETPSQRIESTINTRRLWDMRDEELLPPPITETERLKKIEALKGVRKRKKRK